MDTYATLSDALMRQGKSVVTHPDDFKGIARHINRMTGRGGLGPFEKVGPFLTVPMFAPRFFMSGIQKPLGLFEKSPAVRRLVARDAALFLGTGITLMSLLHRGGVKIETDPRSSDFGKIKAGPTRFDIWGGLQPLARAFAQISFEERKSISSKNISELDRGNEILRFLRSKASPVLGVGITVVTEATFLGEKVETTPQRTETILKETLLPLVADDLWDAFNEAGIGGILRASPAFWGVGVVSFRTLRDLQNKNSIGGDYSKLSQIERYEVNQLPEIVEKIAEMQENQEDLDARTMRQAIRERADKAYPREEEELIRFIDSPGAVKRQAIQTFFTNRSKIGETLYADLEIENLKGPIDAMALDDFRKRYSAVPLPHDPDFLLPDFDAREEARQEILGEAGYFGFSEEQVLERIPLGSLTAQGMIDEYNADQDTLRRYWDISERILSKVAPGAAAQYRAWKRQDRATATVTGRQNPKLRALDRAVSRLREAMRRGDPGIGQLLEKWGYISPSPFAGTRR
jgi:hypothetical protein